MSAIDERGITELITESQDIQVDAMRATRSAGPEMRELRESRGDQAPDPQKIARVNKDRRELLRTGLFGAGGLATRGFLAAGIGTALAAIVARPVAAETDMAVDVLQTAASLENLAIATYTAALGLAFLAEYPVIVTFAETTKSQHTEHRDAFNAMAVELGGKEQTEANPVFAPVVEDAKPGLTTPLAVVDLAAQLEEVATDTYLANLALLEETQPRELMASVMGVEGQHLAVLRAVRLLLAENLPALIAIPVDLAALPAPAGSVAFPDPFQETSEETVAAPDSGDVE